MAFTARQCHPSRWKFRRCRANNAILVAVGRRVCQAAAGADGALPHAGAARGAIRRPAVRTPNAGGGGTGRAATCDNSGVHVHARRAPPQTLRGDHRATAVSFRGGIARQRGSVRGVPATSTGAYRRKTAFRRHTRTEIEPDHPRSEPWHTLCFYSQRGRKNNRRRVSINSLEEPCCIGQLFFSSSR
jgi:hypothetical protein